jgi:hypothetical protein
MLSRYGSIGFHFSDGVLFLEIKKKNITPYFKKIAVWEATADEDALTDPAAHLSLSQSPLRTPAQIFLTRRHIRIPARPRPSRRDLAHRSGATLVPLPSI